MWGASLTQKQTQNALQAGPAGVAGIVLEAAQLAGAANESAAGR
jgi:hypothetical protein